MDPKVLYPRVEKPSMPMEQYAYGAAGSGNHTGPGTANQVPPYYNVTEDTPILSVQQNTTARETCREPPEMVTVVSVPDENIFSMTSHVKVGSGNVFLEPVDVNSFDVIHKLNGAVFKYTQLGLYRVLTILLGIPLSFAIGLLFAIMNFIVVFVMQPLAKLIFVFIRPIAMIYKGVIRFIADPVWQSMGLAFSRISGKYAFNVKGLERTASRAPGGQATIEEVDM